MAKKPEDSGYAANPMMMLMKKTAQKASDSAMKTKMNYKQTLAEAKKEKEEKDKEDLEEAKKSAKARLAASESPELLKARLVQATVKYSLILFLVAILGYGVIKAVPKMFSAAGTAIFNSMQGR